ncbi:hypothetical protein GCM10009744_06700 [Kribbella alba]|uniref:Uncharacterized protein n=1 Tax=Kribbella alba TaxID=190197 RepID=A0ABP4QUS9_9ACTN
MPVRSSPSAARSCTAPTARSGPTAKTWTEDPVTEAHRDLTGEEDRPNSVASVINNGALKDSG